MAEVPDFPVPRSEWAEKGENCSTCGKKFTFFTSKANCPCCGKLCCSDCVQAESAIASNSAPSKVCIDCFSMLQSHRPSVGPEQELFLGEYTERARSLSLPKVSQNQNGEDISAHPASVNDSMGKTNDNNNEGTAITPQLLDQVNALMRSSEVLREENQPRLKQSSDLEIKVETLQEQLDRAHAQIVAKEKQLYDVNYQQQETEKKTADLRDQLKKYDIHFKEIKQELQKSIVRATSSEETAEKLKERVKLYESEMERLYKEYKSDKKIQDALKYIPSTRVLPISIVQETVLTVVPPKPRGALGASVSLSDWDFDTLKVASRVPSILQTVAAAVAVQWNLFSTDDEMQKWAQLTAAVENNYRPNPYHNAAHAADVLQGVFALVAAAPPLVQHMTLLERKAAAFAAMAHDIRHPGRTNAFLAAVHDPVSFRYCGRGTLEQLHTATAFELLTVPDLDITSTMDDTSFLEFKNIVTRLIAHTDMSIHRESMLRWGTKVGNGGFDCTSAEDRIEALSLILHAADIGASSRGLTIAKKWLVVLDEFAEQAEDERRRGLPVTPGFDPPTSVERSQIPFLDFFVIPTFDLLHQLFPSIEEPLQHLRALRESYAASAGVTTPFPASVDYTNRSGKVKELESCIAEFRKREEDVYHYLEDMKAAGNKLKKKSVALKLKENELNERLEAMIQLEGRLKAEFAGSRGGFQNKSYCYGALDSAIEGIEKELASLTSDAMPQGEREDDKSRLLVVHERTVGKDEGFVGVNARMLEWRENKLAAITERLARIAENVYGERKLQLQEQLLEGTLIQRETAVDTKDTLLLRRERDLLTHREAEERLAQKYNEVDKLLLIVRSMRVDCASRLDNEMWNQQLCTILEERELAIEEAVNFSRQWRKELAQYRNTRTAANQLDRLECAIKQLTSAISQLSD
ncbi:FYVE zinc finger [Trypanosoma melophagium]|uniref:FYVE zinc finger n=1 Tax=Trypanosoma melophagium TaxID=715481 RepID=UPI00351A681F|nr:FYVE zinc finger [Trypanosoma melophagium]